MKIVKTHINRDINMPFHKNNESHCKGIIEQRLLMNSIFLTCKKLMDTKCSSERNIWQT